MTSPTPTPPTGSGATSPAGGTVARTPALGTTAPGAPQGAAEKLTPESVKALQLATSAEQAALWAYDLVSAYSPADADAIAAIRSGHLARRDDTVGRLVRGKATAPAAAPWYSVQPVTDVRSARQLSVTIETDCANAWRAVIGSTDSAELRTAALAGLSDSAVWLTTLKIAAKTSPPTIPFPGGG